MQNMQSTEQVAYEARKCKENYRCGLILWISQGVKCWDPTGAPALMTWKKKHNPDPAPASVLEPSRSPGSGQVKKTGTGCYKIR